MKQVSDLYVETAKAATFTIGYGSVDGKLVISTHAVDDRGTALPWGSFAVTASTALLELGDRQMALPGKIVMGRVNTAEQCILLDANTCTAQLGGRQAGNGRLVLRNASGTDTVVVDGQTGNLTLGGGGQDGDLVLTNASGATTASIAGSQAALVLGGSGTSGDITIKDANGQVTTRLDAAGNLTLGGVGSDGDVHITNSSAIETITISGSAGDIIFKNADIAEEFDAAADCPPPDVAPGTVMVLDDDGRVTPCREPYDCRAVGIVAGGGTYRPGIVLDRNGRGNRLPIALVGKVYCRVDADVHPVRVGDLLTTSRRAGHAMCAMDRHRSVGNIIGKALAPLSHGSGVIPVLVKPQ